MKLLVRFLKEDSGATAIEYGLIAVAIFFAILASVQLLGDQLSNLYSLVTTGVGTVQP
ncbi:Flp family type IVb pilin [Aestuariivirga sp. YIM B02566]|uniref:Flp family type IVb pilin n=1 Tax=Taklimakanibacter albus TaxID=2800327 RepID=A0ACC5R671_9HYPH|nr:Flp family type IVb pilin [Aestuariivirga sp. YIM B02566]MBK1868160.1 Flp family type IVb pilin [Aestuariivirga sp. YIM B02566]